ncbi:uncharacterized protein F5Z01DRAFT_673616 [Emericellopsis atlantica]|uniref:Uncharacterized protein n=1 Tax=Emericellopsis atlantica TaxID=2614577 RepID=A0A9P7ZNA0_9HYPO|nr:uncharacterized protein F5Z01DRAFT_673616 [Emericellopsis atlantica]KAG9255071.1 hypothetical protein F5Z01DRAFT_673616 [Emericellopsis atlantica]
MPSLTGKVKTWLQRPKPAEEEQVQVETPLDPHAMDIAAEAVKRLEKGDRWESVQSQVDARRRMHAQRQGHDRVLAGDWHFGPDKLLYQHPNPYIKREPHKVHIIHGTREELDMLEEAGMTSQSDEEFVASYFPNEPVVQRLFAQKLTIPQRAHCRTPPQARATHGRPVVSTSHNGEERVSAGAVRRQQTVPARTSNLPSLERRETLAAHGIRRRNAIRVGSAGSRGCMD